MDAATAGAVSGKVTFEGTPPPAQLLKMAADPVCAEASGANLQNDAVLIKDAAIQNVFVYVKDGLDAAYTFVVPTNALTFDQRGCRYRPRVFGVRAGQPIDIVNEDNTMHNVHALPKANAEFNHSMAMKGEHLKPPTVFNTPEVMVRFKCDVHNWMAAWVGVMAHPFFAVTSDQGTFELKGLPPGTYTIEAWHERFGTQAQKVTVGDRQTQTIAFSFKASARP